MWIAVGVILITQASIAAWHMFRDRWWHIPLLALSIVCPVTYTLWIHPDLLITTFFNYLCAICMMMAYFSQNKPWAIKPFLHTDRWHILTGLANYPIMIYISRDIFDYVEMWRYFWSVKFEYGALILTMGTSWVIWQYMKYLSGRDWRTYNWWIQLREWLDEV